ncbi:hypothetical protein QKG26_gp026 [Chelonid alphaherpesvirus 5]|uniref:Uncharacterized protein n=1 Tax=Chelonid alphaherpesvirus 5 TaxID=702736 RepID=V5NWM1_9ALPH|nr:hypothetical protein QKG26_gp005 [Chelonid alphaherpesvirus 5]YP_010795499.1 hypothetical protein QKG26_gp026 [Chelonid alphaherpesvirus 5]AHA93292.1 hypothetical protein [Chelonid alphaherpesvirus 5]AHA93313.1 hypothetical protein [Chelonid alphaherpesvirus 5]
MTSLPLEQGEVEGLYRHQPPYRLLCKRPKRGSFLLGGLSGFLRPVGGLLVLGGFLRFFRTSGGDDSELDESSLSLEESESGGKVSPFLAGTGFFPGRFVFGTFPGPER